MGGRRAVGWAARPTALLPNLREARRGAQGEQARQHRLPACKRERQGDTAITAADRAQNFLDQPDLIFRQHGTLAQGGGEAGRRETAEGASMRNQFNATAWWRSAVPTVSWTLVCLLAMSLVFFVVAGA